MKKFQIYRFISQSLFFIFVLIGITISTKFVLVAFSLVMILAGVFFCGWICPFGTIQELFSKLGKLIGIKQRKLPKVISKFFIYIRYILLLLTVLALYNDILSSLLRDILSFDPRGNFSSLLNYDNILSGRIPSYTVIGIILLFLFISLFYERLFCNVFCVKGAEYGVFSIFRIFTIKRNASKCINCKKCDKVCPMNIEVSKTTNLRSPQCINCFKCTTSCPINNTLSVNTLSYGLINFTKEKKKSSKSSVDYTNGSLNFESKPKKSSYTLRKILSYLAVSILSISFLTYNYIEEHNIPLESIVPNAIKDNIPFFPNTENSNSQTPENSQISDNKTGVNTTPIPNLFYKNGKYTGIGTGFNGKINVSVTINNDVITQIIILKHHDDKNWFDAAKKGVIRAIFESQKPDVDVVSGATFSSQGIIDSVQAALDKAKN